MSIAVVVGSLAPYTARVYDALAGRTGERIHIFSCAPIEPHRSWIVDAPRHITHSTLAGLRWHRNDASHVYANPGIVTALARMRPDLIVAGAFSPTMALAAAYARLTGTPYGMSIDGTLTTDPGESSTLHGLMRRAMVPGARFAICASQSSVTLLERWGLKPGRGVVVPLVSAWDAPAHVRTYSERPFDLLMAGGINEQFKGVLFFADVMDRLASRGHHLKIRVTGKGPLRGELSDRLARAKVEAKFDGPLQPSDMPDVFGSAKLLAFPSRQDPWGLVANEAVLCGTPVLGSPHAASSPHLVERFGLGLVRPLEADAWCDALIDMLQSEQRWQGFMARRDEAIRWFSLDSAVDAMQQAIDIGRAQRLPPKIGGSRAMEPH